LLSMVANGQSTGAAQEMLTNKLNVYAEQKQTLEKEYYHLDADLKTRQYRWQEPDELNNSIVEFYDKLNGLTEDELYVVRSKLAQIVNSVVDKVYIYMDGYPQGTHKKGDQIIYRVQFQNGAFRVVAFDYVNPAEYHIVLEKVKFPQ
jgi:hypothetical protein